MVFQYLRARYEQLEDLVDRAMHIPMHRRWGNYVSCFIILFPISAMSARLYVERDRLRQLTAAPAQEKEEEQQQQQQQQQQQGQRER